MPLSSEKDKEYFKMLTRVLVNYLKQKDRAMYENAMAVIRDCAEENKKMNRPSGSETSLRAMQPKLCAAVGEEYWGIAEAYLDLFLKKKRMSPRPGKWRLTRKMIYPAAKRWVVVFI